MFKGLITINHLGLTFALLVPQNVPESTRMSQNQTGGVWWELPPILHTKSVLL